MKIIVKGIGDLADYLGKQPHEVELAEQAPARDLLLWIEREWGPVLPAYVWNFEKHCFRGPVFLVIEGKVVQDFDAPLQAGVEVRVMRAVAGG